MSRFLRTIAPVRPLPTAVALAAALALPTAATAAPADPGSAEPLSFGDEFWSTWGDGRAEIATYDLVFPRYGELRSGTAVTIFVTETFAESARVKSDPGNRPASDELPVMKLNLVQDFATGIYDYSLMASTFVGLAASGGRPTGAVAKVTFSSQEWCGHVFHEMVPERNRLRQSVASYFDGESRRDADLRLPGDAIFEDALFHWARGFAGPSLSPGGSRPVSLVTSTERARLAHVPVSVERATVRRSAGSTETEVPAGRFETEEWRVEVDGGRWWSFRVERDGERRIVRWEASDGRRADLVASERLPYWRLNGNEHVAKLSGIGLTARPQRMP